MMRIAVAALLLLPLAACGGRPIVDMQGVNEAQYRADLADCQQYADQVDVGRDAVGGAAFGGLAGAAVGAVTGAIRGNPGLGAALGGAGGGTGGLFAGGARGAQKQDRVVRNCLRGRGYSVLD